MSETLNDKITRLESLNERERAILDFFMADRYTKILDIANSLHLGESTTRNALTSIYDKLEISESEKDRRSVMVREYQEAYREKYLRVEIPSHSGDTSKPEIFVTPKTRHLTQEELNSLMLVVIITVALVAIGVVIVVLVKR
jgi:DNA-binding NarL/FixJ family response regulator